MWWLIRWIIEVIFLSFQRGWLSETSTDIWLALALCIIYFNSISCSHIRPMWIPPPPRESTALVHLHTGDICVTYYYMCKEIWNRLSVRQLSSCLQRDVFQSCRYEIQSSSQMVWCSETISCQLAPSPPTQLLGQFAHFLYQWCEMCCADVCIPCARWCVCECKCGTARRKAGWFVCVRVMDRYRWR